MGQVRDEIVHTRALSEAVELLGIMVRYYRFSLDYACLSIELHLLVALLMSLIQILVFSVNRQTMERRQTESCCCPADQRYLSSGKLPGIWEVSLVHSILSTPAFQEAKQSNEQDLPAWCKALPWTKA